VITVIPERGRRPPVRPVRGIHGDGRPGIAGSPAIRAMADDRAGQHAGHGPIQIAIGRLHSSEGRGQVVCCICSKRPVSRWRSGAPVSLRLRSP